MGDLEEINDIKRRSGIVIKEEYNRRETLLTIRQTLSMLQDDLKTGRVKDGPGGSNLGYIRSVLDEQIRQLGLMAEDE